METNYPSNSHKTAESNEKKNIEKVTSGKVTTKKKSTATKLANIFLSSDISDVKSYVMQDVVIPAIKNTISDALCNGIEMLFNGNARGRSVRGAGTASKPSYSNYYASSYSKPANPKPAVSNDRYDYNDVIFESRVEAEAVISSMIDILENYKAVSVADFYELAGVDGSWNDNKFGWYDLSTSSVVRTHDGYIIKLPRVKALD